MSMAVAVTSPLTLHGVNAELLQLAIDHSLPVLPTVCPMAGSTSPYTVAGTMLVSNVETLLPVLVAQALKPGHPVFYMIGPSVTDLRKGHDLYYKAEKMLFKSMATQMGKFYRLPVAGETAGTMTWRYDPQNGAEGMLYLLASVAGGQNFFGGLGSCHNANGMSAEQIILQCGMVDQAEYVARGVSLSPHELGIESIRAAGPGGNFLTDELTLEFLRGDQFFRTPQFDYAGGYTASKGAVEMAHESVEQMVKTWRPALPESTRAELESYFARL
jgi:trimethylamine--corrinoid protein Co-methyltransferase